MSGCQASKVFGQAAFEIPGQETLAERAASIRRTHSSHDRVASPRRAEDTNRVGVPREHRDRVANISLCAGETVDDLLHTAGTFKAKRLVDHMGYAERTIERS